MIIRQGIKMLLLSLIFICMVVSVYAQTMTKEQEDAFRSAKTARIVVKQSYGEAKDVSLPFEDFAQRLLKYAGLKIVKTKSADMTLNIEAEGRAIGANYGKHYIYSGASLSGMITLELSNMAPYKRDFKGVKHPSPTLVFGKGEKLDPISNKPSRAPFKWAFSELGSFVTQMFEILGDVHGWEFLLNVAAKEKDLNVRKAAMNVALGEMKDKGAVEPIIALLKDKDMRVRKAAVEVLGEINDKRAVEPFIALLKNKRSNVRVEAADALGEMKDKRAVKPLIALLKYKDWDYRDWDIQIAAMNALGKIGDPRSVEPLVAVAKAKGKDSMDRKIRSIAVRALGEIKDKRAVEPLIALLKDKDMRRVAVRALGEIKDKRAVEPLIKLLDEDDAPFVSEVLANIGEPAIKALTEALTDKRWSVRSRSAYALGKIGNEQAVGPLIALLKDSNKSVLIAAAQALGKIKDERAVEPLIALLKDSNSGVRGAAADALGEIKDKSAKGAAETITKMKDPGGNVLFIETYFDFEDKPSTKDLKCFDVCKKKGHDCGYDTSGAMQSVKFKKTLQSKGIIDNCICFVEIQ